MKAKKLLIATIAMALVILGSGAAQAFPLLSPKW
jgi:hypothetical protein